MTDHDPSDELVSAYLDGEATAEERTRVEADPELRARVAVFAATRDAVRADVVALSDDDRDALLARVIGTAIAPTNVVSLHRRRVPPVKALAAAAAVIAVAFLGGAVALLANDGSDSDTSASAGESTIAMSADGDDSAGAAVPNEEFSATTSPADEGSYLGEFANEGALRAELPAKLETSTRDTPSAEADTGATTFSSATTSCDTGTAQVFSATVGEQAVLVLVGDDTVTVLAAADCSVVTSFPR